VPFKNYRIDLGLFELNLAPETPPETINFIASAGGIESGLILDAGTKKISPEKAYENGQ